MSTKKSVIDWDALLGESSLPADEFTWTDGSNYGMDGYHHTQTMGEGLNHGSQPGSTPGGVRDTTMATVGDIPDEMFSTPGDDLSFVDSDPLHIVEDGFNLDSMLGESEIPMTAAEAKHTAASLANLDWLDPTTPQDPERLPQDPHGNMVPELEEAWGVHRRTDGIKLIPNKDREAEQYNESLRSAPPALPGARAAAEKFTPAVRRAIRRSHYGHPLMDIAQELVDTLGDKDPRLAVVMQRIAADHGLAGTVFINANAFPGLKNGKWVKELKRSSRSAAFVLTADETVAKKLGKVKAGSLDWGKVLSFYRPKLAAGGYVLATGGDPKEILRWAFLAGPAPRQGRLGHKPVDVRPADTISAAEAFRQMAAMGKSEIEVVASLEGRAIAKKRAKLLGAAHKWANASGVSAEDVMRLAQSTASIDDLRSELTRLVMATKSGEYTGTGKGAHVHRDNTVESQTSKDAKLEASLRKKFAFSLAEKVRVGLLTKQEASKIFAMEKPVAELQRIATMAVQQAGTLRKAHMPAVEQRDYKGHEFTQAAQKVASMPDLTRQQKKVAARSEETGVPAREFFALLKFATREMNEGMMGNNLTEMLGVRFTPDLLKAAAPLINELRGKHEGLAGNVYVDAQAYATKTGSKGCEEAALKHRANQIRTVLAMPRCNGCVHASEGTCNVYRKPLINAASDVLADVEHTRTQVLHFADANDSEVLGSLFSPAEFALSSEMDNLSLTEMTPTDKLSGIMFGGLFVGEND